MAVNVTEYFTKAQEQGFNAVKQTQEASLDAIKQFRGFAQEFAEKPGTLPTFENVPGPTQLVEMSFGFATQMLELNKSFTLKLAQMFVETQKQAEAAVKVATSPVHTANGTVPMAQKAPVK